MSSFAQGLHGYYVQVLLGLLFNQFLCVLLHHQCLDVTLQLFVMLNMEWATVRHMDFGKEIDLRVE